jgi:hypothetical protein
MRSPSGPTSGSSWIRPGPGRAAGSPETASASGIDVVPALGVILSELLRQAAGRRFQPAGRDRSIRPHAFRALAARDDDWIVESRALSFPQTGLPAH